MQQLIHASEIDKARELYDSRLKESRDIATLRKVAREEAWKEGWKDGWKEGLELGELIGEILSCQELLGQETTSRDELFAMSLDDLKRLADPLRSEFSSKFPRR